MAVALILAADVQQNAVVAGRPAVAQHICAHQRAARRSACVCVRLCVRVCVEFASSRFQLVEQAYLGDEAV